MENEKTRDDGYILIVEDDLGAGELEAQRLEPLGFKIVRASAAGETLEILKRSLPRLMVLDYALPGMNALELIARLTNDSLRVPPFIMVTGRGDEAVAVKSMMAGALDYIVKDTAFLENLLPVARKALEKSALQLKLKKAEEDLRKNLRLYNFLAQVNHAAVREKDRKKLLSAICEVAVTAGGLKMAWVAEPDRDIGRLVPLCSAGSAGDYLRSLRIDLAGGEYSTSPMGAAAARKEITASPDIATDPGFKPWRESALKAGFRSSAALPLLVGNKLKAILGLYSAEPFFFTADEMKLLAEIQGDVSLALEAIQSEERRGATQAALERTARQLTHVMEVNPAILFTLRGSGGRLMPEWVSGDTRSLLGYDTAEILAPGWFEKIIHPQDSGRVLAENASLPASGGIAQDFRVKRKDGSFIWVHCQLKLVSGTPGELIGSWTDITKLKESEERFQELFREAPIGYQSLDSDGNILAVNSIWRRIFGREEKEVLGRSFAEFLTPRSREDFKELFPECKESGGVEGVEMEILGKDGGVRRISFSSRVARNQDGTFRESHCVLTDITGTWQSREQLDLLGQAVRSGFNEVYIFDPESFRFIFASYEAAKNLGYSPEELENMAPWDLQREFTEATFRARVAPLLEGGLASITFKSGHRRKDGTVYPVEARLKLVETGNKRGILAVIEDTTERKKREKAGRR